MEGISDEDLALLLAQGCFDNGGKTAVSRPGKPSTTKATTTTTTTTTTTKTTASQMRRKEEAGLHHHQNGNTSASSNGHVRNGRSTSATTTFSGKPRSSEGGSNDLDEATRLALSNWEDEAFVQALIASTSEVVEPLAGLEDFAYERLPTSTHDDDYSSFSIEEDRRIREQQERDYQVAVAADLAREQKSLCAISTSMSPPPLEAISTPTSPTIQHQTTETTDPSTKSQQESASETTADSTQLREARLRFFSHMNEQPKVKEQVIQHSDSQSSSSSPADLKHHQTKDDNSTTTTGAQSSTSAKSDRRKLKEASDDDDDDEEETDSATSEEEEEDDEKQKCDECKILKSKKEFNFSLGRCRYGKHNCCALCTLRCNARCPGCIPSEFFGVVTKPVIAYEDEKQSDVDFMASMLKEKTKDTIYAKELQILKEIDPSLEDAAAIATLEACEGDVERAALFLGL